MTETIKIMNTKLVRAIAKEEVQSRRDQFFPNIAEKLEAIKENPNLATRYGVSENEIYA